MKRKSNIIEIIQNDGSILYKGVLSELPLREEYIIAMSIELFSEKEPCIIYRTHIIRKFFLNFYETLSNLKNSDIPCVQLKNYFNNIDLDLQNARIHLQ
ncbi:MAG: hypothetical protein K0R00_2556 [Herbinix sp.]|jgi:hypothetical protein|nr:hypothetical protein [Herbinix sp.]